MGKFKDKYKATTKLFTDNLKEKRDEITDQLKENPFEIIPIEDFEKVANDPVGFLEEKFTDMEFIGTVISTALTCVPYVGPMLSSVFSMFWPEDPEDPMKQPVTKEELEAELKKFKDDLLKEIDSKIEKSEQQMWKDICQALFDTLVHRVKEIKDPIIILKKKIKENGEIDSAIATDIRTCFTEIRFNAHQISDFCRNEKYCHLLITTFMRVLFIQCSVMNQLTSQWYQFEIDKYYISGLPAEGNTPAVKSLKEKYHDNLVEGLQHICKAAYKNIHDGRPEMNKEFDEKAEKLFNTNTWIYQLPIVVAPLNVPSIITRPDKTDSGIPHHNIPDRTGPYIYRIDAACFQYDKQPLTRNDGTVPSFKVDSLTKCKGVCADAGLYLKCELPRKRTFKIRVFGIYTYPKESQISVIAYNPTTTKLLDLINLRISTSQKYSKFKIPFVSHSFPNLPPIEDVKPRVEESMVIHDFRNSNYFVPFIKNHSGFTTTDKFENLDTFDILIQTNVGNPPTEGNDLFKYKTFIKFVEIIFLDK